MKKILLLVFAQLFLLTIYAQDTDDCATPDMDTAEFEQLAWFDDNQVLETYLDSIGSF